MNGGRTQVLVNLLWLVPDDVGGSEESTVASLQGLAELAPADLEVRLAVLAPFVAAHPEVAGAFPTEVHPGSGSSRLRRILAEVTWLRSRAAGADLVHHAGGTAPTGGRRPYVLTLHDLQPLLPPAERAAQPTHGRLKRAYLRSVVPRSVRGAARVVVPSEFVRGTVLEATGLAPERVVVVPHGVERPSAAEVTPPDELVRRHRLDGPIVLYPAITYPHKDHATLVEAFARVAEHHPGALLVLTGRPDAAEAALAAQVARLGLADRVRRLGRVPAADLAGLYDLAAVVAVPSRYEGFGLPAAEGLAHGRPVVASASTALPEVVGDAGVLVPPGDVAGWATALDRLLGDAGERDRLGAAGQQRARALRRAANAAALADVYRAAARMGGPGALL